MTRFDYATVAVSIVLFGVVRLHDGLRPAVLPGRRYRIPRPGALSAG